MTEPIEYTPRLSRPSPASKVIPVAVALVAGVALGTVLLAPHMKDLAPQLAQDLGLHTVETVSEVEHLDDGLGGEFSRLLAAVSNDIQHNAVNPPSTADALASTLPALLASTGDEGARYLDDDAYQEYLSYQVVWPAYAKEPDGDRAVVAGRMDGKVGVIDLDVVAPGCVDEVRGVIDDLASKGAESYVLDLRGCVAGTIPDAVDVASLFLEGGTVAEVAGADERFTADYALHQVDEPLVVVVDHRTAGPAEVIASALQAHARAKVVGQATYGDAAIRQMRSLSFGGAVWYAVSMWVDADGESVQETGVQPDIVCLPVQAMYTAIRQAGL